MLRRILVIGGACLGMALIVSPALGVRNLPKKANKYQATVVQGVEVCTTANTKGPGILNTDACDPVVPSDPLCVFTEKGSGKVQAKAKDDVTVQGKLSGLAETCNGSTLCAVASIRTASNNCASTGDCSTIPQADLPLGTACCLIEKGKCKVKIDIGVALPGALPSGNNAEITIGEVGFQRTSYVGNKAFSAGLLLP